MSVARQEGGKVTPSELGRLAKACVDLRGNHGTPRGRHTFCDACGAITEAELRFRAACSPEAAAWAAEEAAGADHHALNLDAVAQMALLPWEGA